VIAGIVLIVAGLLIAGGASVGLLFRPDELEQAQPGRAAPEAETQVLAGPVADDRTLSHSPGGGPPGPWPYVVAIMAGFAIAAAGLALVLVSANSNPSRIATPPGGTASPTASATASATASPAVTTSPTVTGSPTAEPAVLSGDGAVLKPPQHADVLPFTSDADCHLLIEPGWAGDCASVQMAGGTVDWVVQHRPVTGSCCEAYVIRMFTYSGEAGGWVVRLEARDDQAAKWSGAAVKEEDLTGDGAVELIAGFRFQGSGLILAYDLVTDQSGSTLAVAAHSGQLSHGSALVGSGRVDDYSAQYPNNEPNCCPPYFEHRAIQWNGSAFAATDAGRVDPQDVPPSDL
jgi:hypothetical protein